MNKQIQKDLRKSLAGNPTLPSSILFSATEDRSVLTMTLRKAKFCGLREDQTAPQNMQVNGAAFEAWALALYTHWMGRKGCVVLDVDPYFATRLGDEKEYFLNGGHYERFLYRAMRFSEQYEWFQLSEPISQAVAQFSNRLLKGSFTNNVGAKVAGQKDELENRMETALSEGEKAPILRKQLGLSEADHIYRQFPVGLLQLKRKLSAEEQAHMSKNKRNQLYLHNGAKKSLVFSGGKSAMDLWAIRGDTVCPMELKSQNKMMGALTEIFFYSNYMYDLYVDPIPSIQLAPPPKNSVEDRGYSVIRNLSQQGALKQVEGILLLDPKSIHPLMTPEVLETMNQSARKGIQYRIVSYEI